MTRLLTFMAKKKTTPKKPKAKNGSQLPAQAIPFEQSLEDLKVIVSELEAGQLTLGDSLEKYEICLLYTSPSPRDRQKSRMPSSA